MCIVCNVQGPKVPLWRSLSRGGGGRKTDPWGCGPATQADTPPHRPCRRTAGLCTVTQAVGPEGGEVTPDSMVHRFSHHCATVLLLTGPAHPSGIWTSVSMDSTSKGVLWCAVPVPGHGCTTLHRIPRALARFLNWHWYFLKGFTPLMLEEPVVVGPMVCPPAIFEPVRILSFSSL